MNKQTLSKAAWRKMLSAERRQISLVVRQQAAKKAADRLIQTDLFQHSRHIACYYPFPHEFDCLPMIEKCWHAKKNCYLPVLSEIENFLDFVLYEKEMELKPNRYQIPEPVNQKNILPNMLDLVLLPLVGFDQQGNRLGMGAGYYDRTFAFRKHAEKPFLLGVGYAAQGVSCLPVDDFDVRLDGVLTEEGIVYF